MSIPLLKKSLKTASIIKKGDYTYLVHPLTDGIPELDPKLLQEVVEEIQTRLKNVEKVDKIVTIEAMGIPLATALSLQTGIPFIIVRKRRYNLPDEQTVQQITGYSQTDLFINGIQKGDSVVIIDDIISTGGTLRALLSVLRKMKVTVHQVIVVIDKGHTLNQISEKYNVEIQALVTIDFLERKVRIK